MSIPKSLPYMNHDHVKIVVGWSREEVWKSTSSVGLEIQIGSRVAISAKKKHLWKNLAKKGLDFTPKIIV
jgi:hypothetical protein